MRDLEYTLVIRIDRARSALQIARELRTEEYMRYKDRPSLRSLEESAAKQLWFLAYLYHGEKASAFLVSVATEAQTEVRKDGGWDFFARLISGLLAKATVEPVKHQDRDLQFFADYGRDMSAALWCLKKLCSDEVTDVRWETAVARVFFLNAGDPTRELMDSLERTGTKMEQAIAAEANSAATEREEEEEDMECLPTPEQIEKEWASRVRAWSELGLAGNVEAAQRPMAMMQKTLQSVLKEISATEPFVSPRENKANLEPGTLFADRYRIESLIGHGQSGTVYRVVDRLRNAPYALRILPAMAQTEQSRFIDRLRALGHVSSDHIVKIHAIEKQADGTPYLLMELLQGVTLWQRLSRASIPLTEAREILYQLGAALAAVHECGLIHGDVKPSSIMLSTTREGGMVPKFIDLGIRSALELDVSQLTQELALDILRYRAPEAIYRSGAAVDARADQWSFAVLGYQLLSGHLPFDGENPAALIKQVLSARPVPVTQHAATLSPKVAQIIACALSKNPQDRFATIREFSTVLHAALLQIPKVGETGRHAAQRETSAVPEMRPRESQPRTSQWGMVAAPAASSKSGPAKAFGWTCKVDELGVVKGEEAEKAKEGTIHLLKVSLIGELLPDAPNAITNHYLVEWDVTPPRPLTKLRFRFQRGESGSRWIRLDAPVGREFINLPGDQEPQFILTSELIE